MDRVMHRALVEAGYADLADYVAKWSNPKPFPPGDDPDDFEDDDDEETPDFELPDEGEDE